MISILADLGTSVNKPFWGGYATTSYKILFAIHIMAVIGAFGPLFVTRTFNLEAIKRTGEDAKALASMPLAVVNRMSIPAFIVAVIAGLLLIADSNDLYKFEQAWVSYAFSLALVIALVYWFLFRPAQRRLVAAVQLDNADELAKNTAVRSAKATSAAAIGLIHLCMLGLIILMVWKPGL
jgi:uncharacterized membrane protein